MNDTLPEDPEFDEFLRQILDKQIAKARQQVESLERWVKAPNRRIGDGLNAITVK